jgi:hypothetical protein
MSCKKLIKWETFYGWMLHYFFNYPLAAIASAPDKIVSECAHFNYCSSKWVLFLSFIICFHGANLKRDISATDDFLS